jgi:site-specific DNA-methyltransferase (adenine-specific)
VKEVSTKYLTKMYFPCYNKKGGKAEDMEFIQIIHGDCLQVLHTFPSSIVDSVVTDPPYGLSKEPDIREVLEKWLADEDYTHRGNGFMGKTWDSFVPGPSVWREVYRVLKPGGHALVFAGTRTQDLMTVSLRLAGFEVRDVIEWLYFSGFPKSMDVGKAFDKRARAEREIIGENPSSRPNSKRKNAGGFDSHKGAGSAGIQYITAPVTPLAKKWDGWGTALKPAHEPIIVARKPLDGTVADNVERFGTGAINIDACRIGDLGERKRHGGGSSEIFPERGNDKVYMGGRFPANCVTTEPDTFFSEYFNVTPEHLCKKASKQDRNSDWRGEEIGTTNRHPTVKPTELMAWLVRLITPPGGIVLDPFAGSGSTCVAARREGFFFIGIEQELEYVKIARERVGEIDTVLS